MTVCTRLPSLSVRQAGRVTGDPSDERRILIFLQSSLNRL